jgi:uncharacterized membrane protein YkvA (DUF1232 family)
MVFCLLLTCIHCENIIFVFWRLSFKPYMPGNIRFNECVMDSDLPDKKHHDFYHSLRGKIDYWLQEKKIGGRYSKYILLAPDIFHLLCKLSMDPDVPVRQKVKLGVAIAYFISPMDVVPELLVGPMGYMDDIALAAYVLNSIVNHVEPEIVKKHWAGDENILEIIKHILARTDKMLGKGVWEKVKRTIK